ncbi:hypothetical protein PRIPAC_84278 [Pristionchus pacificus]|uniref:CUB domain-containing protein n=1 Tax=Pristionchus pacificus TaxID=54126 RepID=A0A2A6BTS8_PRIPA|nr:hypothetical protein PRIPAC_84278 [Pristionchus pacificus]|eukprot:PDM69295.1 CUB domain-containing protein [Pristionchus pacificus]
MQNSYRAHSSIVSARVRVAMRGLLLLFFILPIVHSSCPDGFELYSGGQCLELQPTQWSGYRADQAVSPAIAKCKEKQAQPVIIHNSWASFVLISVMLTLQHNYWENQYSSHSNTVVILGIVCNTISLKYQWSDHSAIDFKPSSYNSVCDSITYTYNLYCTAQLPVPIYSEDGCEYFDDDSDDGVCYKIGAAAETWQDAQLNCKKVGANLASIHNQQENNFLRRLAVSNLAVDGLFLGATISGKEDHFGWIDGTDWDYQNFYAERQNLPTNSECGTDPYLEDTLITSPGFPYNASIPCEYFLMVDEGKNVELEIVTLEANSCCDYLLIYDGYLGSSMIANVTGAVQNVTYTTTQTSYMRVVWQPNGDVAISFCPPGFDLVRGGQCRGFYTTVTVPDDVAENIAANKCKEIMDCRLLFTMMKNKPTGKAAPPALTTSTSMQFLSSVDMGRRLVGRLSSAFVHSQTYFDTHFGESIGKDLSGSHWCDTDVEPLDVYCTAPSRQPIPSGHGCESFEDDSDDGVCYQVGAAAENWKEAQIICGSFGAQVASIHNEKGNSFLRRLAVSKGAVSGMYLGASVSGKADNFSWIDGTTWNYDNFYSGFPITGLGDCIIMDTGSTGGEWANVDCSTKIRLYCSCLHNRSLGGRADNVFSGISIRFSIATTPCDFILYVDSGKKIELEVLLVEANPLTGEVNDKKYTTSSSNFMRVSWQPTDGKNVRGAMFTYKAV